MRIRDPGLEEEPYNLVPLTDMVFNLLIFFMAATTFTQIEKDLAVQLPKAGGFQTLSAAPKQIVINIREDGSTYVDGRQRSNEQLSELLSGAGGPHPRGRTERHSAFRPGGVPVPARGGAPDEDRVSGCGGGEMRNDQAPMTNQ